MESKMVRKLMKIKREIKQEESRTFEKTKHKLMTTRRKLINEYIYNEIRREERKRIDNIVKELEESGGIKSNKFWELREIMKNKNEELKTSIMDKNGEMKENKKEIINVYKDFYERLLTTPESITEEEEIIELNVKKVISEIEDVAKNKQSIQIEGEEVKAVIKTLKKQKAKDRDNWNNELIIEGGREMVKSLTKMFNKVNKRKQNTKQVEKNENQINT